VFICVDKTEFLLLRITYSTEFIMWCHASQKIVKIIQHTFSAAQFRLLVLMRPDITRR